MKRNAIFWAILNALYGFSAIGLALILWALLSGTAHAQTVTTTPVVITANEPATMFDGSPVRPDWYLFYNLYQGANSSTLALVAGNLLPGATVVLPVKGGACFSISSVSYNATSQLVWFPLESPIAPAVSGAPTPGGCKAASAGSSTYTVTLSIPPW